MDWFMLYTINTCINCCSFPWCMYAILGKNQLNFKFGYKYKQLYLDSPHESNTMSINKKYFHHTVSHTFNQHIVIESIRELPLGDCHVQSNTHLYTDSKC
jgi:hypothetical protein